MNSIDMTLTLLECMAETGVSCFVSLSSTTVYGSENSILYVEMMPKDSFTSPYGWSKSIIEQILQDAIVANDLKIPYEIGPKRAGNLPQFWANADKTKAVLNRTAKRDLKDMCGILRIGRGKI